MIDFGEWITENEQLLSEDVFGLFFDSFRCFKNDIDRPAYLLAYQGMMQHVRETVLQSLNKPTGYLDAEWEANWLNPLRNDGKWDELAFKCIQTKENTAAGKAAVMNIRQEVREKFDFWRQLRNVCAHYKGYDLNKAHTLALYSFIEQYLMTLNVEGSRESLNKQFDDYFNPMITSVHADITPLLNKIDIFVQDNEMDDFFEEVSKSCSLRAPYTNRFFDFVHRVLDVCPARIRDAAIKYIQSDNNLRDYYLESYPDDVLKILKGTDVIHNFWYARLPHIRKKFVILALMLEADYIPDMDKRDAMIKCLTYSETNATSSEYSVISKELSNVLAEKGLFDIFYEKYFNPDNTSRNAKAICYKTDFYIGIISMIPWGKKYVEQLIGVFNEQFYPFTLQSRLQEMYRQDSDYKEAIDKICLDNGLTLPSLIV